MLGKRERCIGPKTEARAVATRTLGCMMDMRGVSCRCRTLGGFKTLIIVTVTRALRLPIFVRRAAIQIEFREAVPSGCALSVAYT